MEIRKATVEDLEQLTKLRIEFLRKNEEDPELLKSFEQKSYEYFKENIQSGDFVAYVAVVNSEIIATSGVCFYTLPPTYEHLDGKNAYIMNMYTKPKYRGKGIASLLLSLVVQEAKNRNCTKINLNSTEMGKPIYEKYGFFMITNYMEYHLKDKK